MFFKKLFSFFRGGSKADKLNEQGKRLIESARAENPRDDRKYSKAINLFKQAMADDAKNIETLINLGAALCDSESYEMAVLVLQQAEAQGSDDAHMFYNMGAAMMHISSDSRTNAHFYFKKAENQPRPSSALRALYDYQTREQ
ncbi:MAG: hypothetical protein OEY89_05360 [Gammaproteobacteria bacterium]|nr:hypothetical protein [Gammaproteobacteria bacterium]